jgi:nitrogen fixation NifU-like protein
MSDDSPQIYDQNLMHHSQNPHNKGELKNPDLKGSAENPNCGDRIKLGVNVKDGTIRDIKFDGYGCVLCIGSASILTQLARGLSVGDAKELTLNDIEANMNDSGKKREDCMAVGLNALHEALTEGS